MKRLVKVIFYIQVFFLMACSNHPNNVIEDIAPSILYYFDKGENEKYYVSTMVPPVKNEKRVILSTEETMIKDIKNKLNSQYFRDIKDGQLRLVFFSEELARDVGVQDILNALYTDPAVSDRIFLGIITGDFNKVLFQNDFTDYLLFTEMKHNEEQGEILVTDMHEYLKTQNSEYSDPYIPHFSVNGNDINYTGLALMKNNKMVGKLDLLKSKFFDILLDGSKYEEVITFKETQVAMGLVNTKLQKSINTKKKTINLNIGLSGIVSEYQGGKDLSKKEEQQKLENEITEEIFHEILDLIKSFQRQNIDPLELGLLSKGVFSKAYSQDEWEDVWPQYKVNLEINLNIQDYGIYFEKKTG